MALKRIKGRPVERVWGRTKLPNWVGTDTRSDAPIGEVWFEKPDGNSELLIKYLFTSERLSIQVHPDEQFARASGYERGKDEAWVIVEAGDGAEIATGLTDTVSADALRAAALDGSIEQLVNWRSVERGEIIFCPAGTIHSLGAGLTALEIQQNLDVTYRLYDYGRGRELHLDEGIRAAQRGPVSPQSEAITVAKGREVAVSGNAFTLERWRADSGPLLTPGWGKTLILAPIGEGVKVGGTSLPPGSLWNLDEPSDIEISNGSELIVAYRSSE